MSATSQLKSELAGPPRPLSLIESARVLGGLCFVELEAFFVLGKMAGEGRLPPRVAVWASGSARAHGKRARELEALLPVSKGLPGPLELTCSPGRETERFLAELAPLVTTGDAIELSQWYETLAAAYETRAAHLHESADGALARTMKVLLKSVALAMPATAW